LVGERSRQREQLHIFNTYALRSIKVRRILIVDDEETNQRLLKAILEAKGYVTLQAFDGAEGVQFAKETKPDLILMDIQVPEINGIEAFKILQSDPLTMNIPVLALTSYAMRGDREKFLSIGFRDYIAKPVSINDFLELVEYYCS
jgi:two-component system, cell cycle response regulator DivK